MLRIPFVTASIVLALWVGQALSYTEDSFEAAEFHPFTLGTCTASGDCDPINLIFKGRTSSQVRSALQAQGWTTFGFGSNQQLHFANENVLYAQDVQMFLYEGFDRRYHIRLWQVPGTKITVGAVHHEEGILEHAILNSWEESEALVAGQLCPIARSCSQETLAAQDSIQGGDGWWRDHANNASATVIRLR